MSSKSTAFAARLRCAYASRACAIRLARASSPRTRGCLRPGLKPSRSACARSTPRPRLWTVVAVIRPPPTWATRSRSSEAARTLNETARIASGGVPDAIWLLIAWRRRSVLPAPAPAMMIFLVVHLSFFHVICPTEKRCAPWGWGAQRVTCRGIALASAGRRAGEGEGYVSSTWSTSSSTLRAAPTARQASSTLSHGEGGRSRARRRARERRTPPAREGGNGD